MSLELLGAEMPRGLLIRVKNVNKIVANQGGKAGSAISAVADALPDVAGKPLETLVLDKMANQLRTQLAEKGVDTDVTVVSATAHKPATSGFASGVAVGAGAAALLMVAWKFVLSKLVSP